MLLWQPFLAFYIWGAHWRHLKNTTEPSMCGGDAALCQITLTTCYFLATLCKTVRPMLSERCPVPSVCDVGVLWPNGWTDQDEIWHAARPRP